MTKDKDERPGYWEIRDLFQEAAATMDREALSLLIAQYPDIFKNIMGQAQNARKNIH